MWGRGSQPEIDPATMSATLLQAFTFALADYVTEYKLLQPFYNNSRYSPFEPPPSPRLLNPGKFSDETSMFFTYLFAFLQPFLGHSQVLLLIEIYLLLEPSPWKRLQLHRPFNLDV